ncbi:class I SAM-dependent methyltransferase [Roseobacter sp.]|uniref:class I SAM-dependent methyltransferase n=1 Tax=Roseobacter sp. TaxID=1907202 RepID=UPI003299ACB1
MTQDNSDQATFWTSDAGGKWVAQQQILDQLMQPVLDGVLNRAKITQGQAVLDIGCGTGDSSLRAADLVGAQGRVLGADISPTMLGLARQRAADHPNVAFVEADAAQYAFGPAQFDHLISRFGVMFFTDPIAAFSNMRSGLKPGAYVTFATWGQITNNPWFTAAAQAAKQQLGAPPPTDPDAPGPFSMRNVDQTVAILSQAGFDHIRADVDPLHLTPQGDAEAVAQMATSIGPAARTLDYFKGTPADRAAIVSYAAQNFQRYETSHGLRIPAEINFFSARCP